MCDGIFIHSYMINEAHKKLNCKCEIFNVKFYKMKTARTVKTILRTDKKKTNGECPLYFRVIFNSELLKLPVGISLKQKDWDSKRSYPKGNALLSKKLEKKEQAIKDFIDDCDLHGKVVTKSLIKEFYNGRDGKKDFYYHFDRFTEKKFYEISEGTQKHYLLLRKQLKEYKPNLLLIEMDVPFLEDFFHHLRHKRKIGNSGIAMRRKNLMTVLRAFIKSKLIKENPCEEIPIIKEKEKTVFLTTTEVDKIKNVNLEIGSLARGLNLTRDKFLFSCYTGLRYSDVENLMVKEIKGNCVVKSTQKTNKEVNIPLIEEAIQILKKYDYKRKFGLVFPRRCNVSVNRDLKFICTRAKIKKNVSFHVARHTFGSTLANEGVQPFYIMKLMGHTDVNMTKRYVNSDNEMLQNVMKNVNFKVA